MRTVTECTVCRVLAVAKGVTFFFSNFDFLRRKTAPLMGTITKGLLAGLPAGTPPIITRFEFQNRR